MELNLKLDVIQNNKFIDYYNNIVLDNDKYNFLNNIIELGFNNYIHLSNVLDKDKIIKNEITMINKINQNINNSLDNVIKNENMMINNFNKSLDEIKILFNKNSTKCNLGENLIEEYFKNHNLVCMSGVPHSGDYHLKLDNLNIIIESKYYKNIVPEKEIEKLKFDMNHCGCNYSIFVSFNSSIQKKNDLSWEIFDNKIILFIGNAIDNKLLNIAIPILKNLINLTKTNNPDNINKINQFADNAYNNIHTHLDELINLKTNIGKIKNNILTIHENTSKQILNLYNSVSSFDVEYNNKLECINKNLYKEFEIINKNIKNLEINNIPNILDQVQTSQKELLSDILNDLSNMDYTVKLDKKIIIIYKDNKEVGNINVLKSRINFNIYKIKFTDVNILDWNNYKQLL